jgi:SAM-dependent MidA family methyltransferase
VAHICAEAKAAGGTLPFWRFMELALYAPALGYYVAGSRKFGAEGDFVTAPEISPLFSRCLARQCAPVLEELRGGDILEFGAGSGALAAAMLRELADLGQLPGHYYILEISPDLVQRQRQVLQAQVPDLLGRVVWLDRLPAAGFRGVVIANEVLDAMPVHRFRVTDAGVRELGVGCAGETLQEVELEPGPRLHDRVAALAGEHHLSAPYESEVNFAAEDWVHAVSAAVESGAVLLIDYGFPAREFYHTQRATGTLMCHYRHRAHADPLVFVGLQDITAHVDFTAIAEAAHAAGFHVAGYANQGSFLLSTGLVSMLGEASDARAHLTLTAQVKKLTLPSEMGELFKVLALTRGLQVPLAGFALRDERSRL